MQLRNFILAVALAASQAARADAQSSSPSKQPPAPAHAGAPPAPAAVHIPFIEGKPFSEVLRRARAENKPVMLDVVASWCGPCKIMDKTAFSDPGVVDWAKKNVIPARVDAEKGEGRRISARYQAFSFPTVVFLAGDGNEIDRLVGGYGAVDFQRGAEALLAGRTQLLVALARLKAAWNAEEAIPVSNALAARRDLARVRPIALRIVSEEGDLGRPEIFLTAQGALFPAAWLVAAAAALAVLWRARSWSVRRAREAHVTAELADSAITELRNQGVPDGCLSVIARETPFQRSVEGVSNADISDAATVGMVGGVGVGAMFKGGEFNRKYSNKLMRLRVLLQAVALLLFAIFMLFFRDQG